MQKSFLPTLAQTVVFISSISWGASFYSNANMDLFILPPNAAMGEANLCFTRDATAQSNPANIALDTNSEVVLSYAGYYLNAFSSPVASYVTTFKHNAGFGFSINYLNIPDIENTNDLQTMVSTTGDTNPIYDRSRIRMVSSSDIVINCAYAQKFAITRAVDISFGGLIHGLRRRLPTATDEATGYGIGLDAGATVAFWHSGVRLSLLVNDITTSYIAWGGGYHENGLPHLRLGFAWKKAVPYIYGAFTVAYKSPDLLQNEGTRLIYDNDLDTVSVVEGAPISQNPAYFVTAAHIGLEYLIRNIVAIRAGLTQGKFSFGGGIAPLESLSFDFSYAISDLPGSYAVSLRYRW
jgi:hypothetical protein